jgi:hypothetical protein
MNDAKEFIDAMQYLPQQFDEIIRRDSDFQLERMNNGTYILHRKQNAYRWHTLGDVHKSYPSGNYVALINKPYDATDDSDAQPVYEGDDLEAAINKLWDNRDNAYIY